MSLGERNRVDRQLGQHGIPRQFEKFKDLQSILDLKTVLKHCQNVSSLGKRKKRRV